MYMQISVNACWLRKFGIVFSRDDIEHLLQVCYKNRCRVFRRTLRLL